MSQDVTLMMIHIVAKLSKMFGYTLTLNLFSISEYEFIFFSCTEIGSKEYTDLKMDIILNFAT